MIAWDGVGMTLPEWVAMREADPPPPPGWVAARTAIAYGVAPTRIVGLLRLLLPCRECDAAPLTPCTRRLGEVAGTHAQRGA